MRRYTAILMVSMVVPLFLSSCFKKDTPPAVSQEPAVQEGQLSLAELEVLFASGAQAPYSIHSGGILELISELQTGRSTDIGGMIASLTGTDKASIDKRSYLRSYMGDYSGALAEKAELCKIDATLCPKPAMTIDIGEIKNQSGESLNGVRISVDGISVPHDSAILQPEVYENMIHRIRVEKEGYLDAYDRLNHVPGGTTELVLNPVLAKADTVFEIDNQVGGTYTAGEGSGAITYTIAPDTFVDKKGKPAKGKVMAYFFSLTSSDQSLSAFQLDAFSSTGGRFQGSSMVTNGMPFVTAYQNSQELDIAKDIDGIGIMGPSVVAVDYENVPKNTWLSYKELQQYKFPGYWTLNRKTGVWTESSMQILDTNGTYKFKFR